MWLIILECNNRHNYYVTKNYQGVEYFLNRHKSDNLNKIDDNNYFYYIGNDRIYVEIKLVNVI